MKNRVWNFPPFRFSLNRGLEADGRRIELQPKVHGLLHLLLEADGMEVNKGQIVERLWRGAPVADNSVARCASLLRKALDRPERENPLKTVYGTGFRLAVKVISSANREEASEPAAHPVQQYIRAAFEVAARRTEEGFRNAALILAEASEKHPESPEILGFSATVILAQAVRGFLAPDDAARRAEHLVEAALILRPDHTGALANMGWTKAILRGRPAEGRDALDRAISRNPKEWLSFFYRAWVRAASGDLEGAIEDVRASLELSPVERAALGLRSWLVCCSGRFAPAMELSSAASEIRPDVELLPLVQSVAMSELGDDVNAVAYASRAVRIGGGDAFSLSFLAYAWAKGGQAGEARKALAKAGAGNRYVIPSLVAPAILALGDKAGAISMIEESRRKGCPWSAIAWCDPRLAKIGEELKRF